MDKANKAVVVSPNPFDEGVCGTRKLFSFMHKEYRAQANFGVSPGVTTYPRWIWDLRRAGRPRVWMESL